jgi:hypothetical protein
LIKIPWNRVPQARTWLKKPGLLNTRRKTAFFQGEGPYTRPGSRGP